MKQTNTAKKKKMKRSDAILLWVVVGLLLLGTVAAIVIPTVRNANRMDRAERRLEEAGFLVLRTVEGDGSALPLDEDLSERIEGRGGPNGEFLKIFKFKDKEKAEAYYEVIKDEYTLTRTAVLKGKYVYCGTRTAYELVK
jgi:hypothetical protein